MAGLEDFQARSDRCGSTIVADLLGLGGADPGGGADGASRRREARLATTDPERLLPLDPPQLLLYGAEDAIVPPAHGLAWERKVRATGGAVEIRVVPGAGHFELVAPWTAPCAAVEDALGSFLGRTGVVG